MDKDFYDITIKLRNIDKKYFNTDFKELHFRMVQDIKEILAIIRFAMELVKREIISIKDIIVD